MLRVHSIGHHFMHLGVLFEAMSGKRVLIIAPDGKACWKQWRELTELVQESDIGHDARCGTSEGSIRLQGHGGRIYFESWKDSRIWLRRGMADYELTYNVDYVLFLNEADRPTGEVWTELHQMVDERKGQVVFG